MVSRKIRKKIKRELIGTSEYPSNKIFTISNFITILRLILTIVFLYCFTHDVNRYISLAIYFVAASTDWLDGQIARLTKTVSWFGKILDPIVDRALLFTGVIGLVSRGELPLWICIVIVGRDLYLLAGNTIVRHFHKRPIDVVFVGKLATALLMSGFTLMLFGFPVIDGLNAVPSTVSWLPGLNNQSAPLGIFLVYPGVIFSLCTAVVYTIRGFISAKHAIDCPDEEDDDFLNPEIENDSSCDNEEQA